MPVSSEWHSRAIARLGGKCVRCGFADARALQIDHVNGGGRAELLLLGAHRLYKSVALGERTSYQLLCANCNWIKRHERNEHRGMSWHDTHRVTRPKRLSADAYNVFVRFSRAGKFWLP